MELSTHQDHQPRVTVWSIGLIIAASALLAVLIEPHWPDIAARSWNSSGDVATVSTEASIQTTANTTARFRTGGR